MLSRKLNKSVHILTASEGNVLLQSSCFKECLLVMCSTPWLLTLLKPSCGLVLGWEHQGLPVSVSASGAVQHGDLQHHVLIASAVEESSPK